MVPFPFVRMLVVRPMCAQEGDTPALFAAKTGHTEALQVLIEARADVNKADNVSISRGADGGSMDSLNGGWCGWAFLMGLVGGWGGSMLTDGGGAMPSALAACLSADPDVLCAGAWG